MLNIWYQITQVKTFDCGLYDLGISYLENSFYHSRSSGLVTNKNFTKNHFQWLRAQKSIIINPAIFWGLMAWPKVWMLGLGHYTRAFTLVDKWGNSPEWQLCNICHPKDRKYNWMFTLFRPLRTLLWQNRHICHSIEWHIRFMCLHIWVVCSFNFKYVCINIYKFTFLYL